MSASAFPGCSDILRFGLRTILTRNQSCLFPSLLNAFVNKFLQLSMPLETETTFSLFKIKKAGELSPGLFLKTISPRRDNPAVWVGLETNPEPVPSYPD